MHRTIRTGFDSECKRTLDQESDRGVVLNATPAERLAMVWPITAGGWAFVPRVSEGRTPRKEAPRVAPICALTKPAGRNDQSRFAHVATSRSRRSPSRSFSNSRAYRICKLSQNLSVVRKKRANRRAVSAVIERCPRTISLIRRDGTLMSFAKRYWLIPKGARNSS